MVFDCRNCRSDKNGQRTRTIGLTVPDLHDHFPACSEHRVLNITHFVMRM